MSDYLIREYEKADIPELMKLWRTVFDEDPRMISAFFSALEHMGSGLVAQMDGRIVGAGYALTGQSLVQGETHIPLGLIYGISVAADCRSHGIGRAVTNAVIRLARERGAEIVACEPANESLVKWYGEVSGLVPAIRREESCHGAKASVPCRAISGAEYARKREELLSGKNRVVLSEAALRFEEDMLKIYGGGFFALGEGICAAYLWEDAAIVRELICPPELSAQYASSVAAALSAKEAKLFRPSPEGLSYILTDRPMPPDCLWNLSFN